MTIDAITGLFESNFKKIFFPNRSVMSPLFHYTSPTSFPLIQKSEKLWFSRFDNSNDDLEFRYGLNLAIRQFRLASKNDLFSKDIFEKYIPFLEQEKNNPSLIFMMACFSSIKKSRYLWWKYAHKNQGRCLEFIFSDQEMKNMGPVIFRFVIYKRKKFKKLVLQIIREYSMFIRQNIRNWISDDTYNSNMGNLIISMHRDIFTLSSFCKRRRFRNELEYRIAIWIKPTDSKIKIAVSKSVLENSFGQSLKHIHQHS